ncbi:MAG: PAS domain S-box protein [Mariprofundaceae bacterium]|nr:PAS domain S-box protein [Mariprofundaceae bacterium]
MSEAKNRQRSRQTEAQLRKLSYVIEQSPHIITIVDRQLEVEYVNEMYTKRTGFLVSEAIAKPLRFILHGEQNAAWYERVWAKVQQGEVWQGLHVNQRKDASFFPEEMIIFPMRIDQEDITHFVIIQQAQKMESVGTLVGGIAHDFNNMLTGILGNIYLARSCIEEKPAQMSEAILYLDDYAANMIDQLMRFARKTDVDIRPFCFNFFLKEAMKLARVSVPEDIELSFSVCRESLHITGDSTQLQQMLMNLLNNARDALQAQEKPKISVDLSYFQADKCFQKKHPNVSSRCGCQWSRGDVKLPTEP